jgi:hypothetical protein
VARRADEPHFHRLSSDTQPTAAKIKPAVQSAPARISTQTKAVAEAARYRDKSMLEAKRSMFLRVAQNKTPARMRVLAGG